MVAKCYQSLKSRQSSEMRIKGMDTLSSSNSLWQLRFVVFANKLPEYKMYMAMVHKNNGILGNCLCFWCKINDAWCCYSTHGNTFNDKRVWNWHSFRFIFYFFLRNQLKSYVFDGRVCLVQKHVLVLPSTLICSFHQSQSMRNVSMVWNGLIKIWQLLDSFFPFEI